MAKLTIEQIKYILDISYPTALALAQEHGERDGRKWLVPSAIIQGMVDADILRAQKQAARYNHICDSEPSR